MNKTLVFDMDGTIADLYNVENWLVAIREEKTYPYEQAKPMYNVRILNTVLTILKTEGWRIVVTTWLPKDGKEEYSSKVMLAKIEWLEKYDFPYDEIHITKYGQKKSDCTESLGGFQILIDDNEDVRKTWSLGDTFDAKNNDVIDFLLDLLED